MDHAPERRRVRRLPSPPVPFDVTHSSAAESAADLAAALYHDAFGGPPAGGASAPGRVNLIGEHLDYNGGPVMPVALERRTAVVAAPADDWEMVSSIDGRMLTRDPAAPMGAGWTDYVAGVVRELRALDAAPAGARLAVSSTVPVGAGLSSSAALTVAAAAALSAIAGRRLPPAQLVEVAYRAEHDQVGVRVGRMDQTIAAYAEPGTALFFDTPTGDLTPVPLTGTLWIVETGVSHRLTGGELNSRRRECETALAILQRRWPELRYLAGVGAADLETAQDLLADPALARRVRHVVTETARTRAAAAVLANGDLPALGALLLEGHESLRADYESTIPEADLIVAAAARHGAFGARLTGAGWGGAVVVLAAEGTGDAIAERVTADFARAYGREPAAWSSRAGGGVRAEDGHR